MREHLITRLEGKCEESNTVRAAQHHNSLIALIAEHFKAIFKVLNSPISFALRAFDKSIGYFALFALILVIFVRFEDMAQEDKYL